MKKTVAWLLTFLLSSILLHGCDKLNLSDEEETTKTLQTARAVSSVDTINNLQTPNKTESTTETNDTPTEKPEVNFAQLFEGSDTPANVIDTYLAVLNNEVKVRYTGFFDGSQDRYLSHCPHPYSLNLLGNTSKEQFTVVDMDGDGVMEVLVSDTIVLHYEDGIVYGYGFTFNEMYYPKTDGTFSWSYSSQNMYGNAKLQFDGATYDWIEIYRIVNDGTDFTEYYIDEKKVTPQELQEYIEQNECTVRAEWYSLEGISIVTEDNIPEWNGK